MMEQIRNDENWDKRNFVVYRELPIIFRFSSVEGHVEAFQREKQKQ
jgi:hypothetical protein